MQQFLSAATPYILILIPVAVFVIFIKYAKSSSQQEDPKAPLRVGFAIGGLSLLGFFFCTWFVPPKKGNAIAAVDFLVLIAGGTLGWLFGILLSPSEKEKPQFHQWGTAIVTFLSGVVTCKFGDPIVNAILEKKLSRYQVGEALVFIDAFVICMLMVFVARKYWTVSQTQAHPTPVVPIQMSFKVTVGDKSYNYEATSSL
jgi:uncharacterized membrane-anchored protein YitT (DUF2179 family)